MSWVNRTSRIRREWLIAHRAYWSASWVRRLNHLGCKCGSL